MNLPDMPEAILRRIWQEQTFSTDRLRTTEGSPVTILFPGTPNADGGPDFLNAKIAVGGTTFHGDVELHINAAEWLAHKHDTDPHYNKVILHVVLVADPVSPPARTASRRAIPLLVLHPFLDEKLYDAWTRAVGDDRPAGTQSLACSDRNAAVPFTVITQWLDRLATERIELKVRRFEERLRQLVDETRHVLREPYPRYYGDPAEIPAPKHEYSKRDFSDKRLWDQLLYEGIMECLGYSKNTKPFLALARSMRLDVLRKHGVINSLTMMALLFGAAGLLPSGKDIESKEAKLYVLKLKTIWKSLQTEFKGQLLNEADWLFFRLRPTNFPTARLAAMSFLLPKLFGEQSFRGLIRIFKDSSLSPHQRSAELHALFSFCADDFWSHHFHFKGRVRKGAAASKSELPRKAGGGIALGAGRINDILVNALVPIVLLYGRIFKDPLLSKHTRIMLDVLPPSQKNSVTEIIQQQLVRAKGQLNSARLQQGSIQLYRYYCTQARCTECVVGRRTMLLKTT